MPDIQEKSTTLIKILEIKQRSMKSTYRYSLVEFDLASRVKLKLQNILSTMIKFNNNADYNFALFCVRLRWIYLYVNYLSEQKLIETTSYS